MVDYHTHTELCKHATGGMHEYVEAAIAKGLAEIGISCHNPMPDGYDPRHRMSMDQFLNIYKPTVDKLRETYAGRIDVMFGIEADYFPGTESFVESFLEDHEFDYVIGSVHYLGEWGKTDPYVVQVFDPSEIDGRYTAYYRRVAELARSGLFDIVAHFDLVKKNGHRSSENDEVYEARETALSAIRNAGMSMEINSSGLRKKIAEIYPSEDILSLACELEIPIAAGSDAHAPGDVGADFDLVAGLLDKYAGGKVAVYRNRIRSEMSLGGAGGSR